MKRRILLFIITLSSLTLWSQEVITVMQYNLLEYGNYNSGFAQCYESNNNTQHKDECIRTIMDYVKPDILTVCEFGATAALLNDFMRHNLNINGANYWQSDNIINYAGSNIINHIFFDSRKFGLGKHISLHTTPRDTDVYELFLKTPSLADGDTIKLVCIVAHPKAGEEYEAQRRALMQIAMDHINRYYPTDNVLIMGDFNMYGASESGYQLLTRTYSNPDVCFVDPLSTINGVGEWHNSLQFVPFHTQSTRSSSSQCFSSGGMDDRFDFILMADEIMFNFNHLRYMPDSYRAIGNDGLHFNQSINQGTNADVPAQVAQALYDCSDHLPVTMKILADVSLGVEELGATSLEAYAAPNPAMDVTNAYFFNPSAGIVQFELYSLQGQLLAREFKQFDCGTQQHTIELLGLQKGFYILKVRHNEGWEQKIKLIVQ